MADVERLALVTFRQPRRVLSRAVSSFARPLLEWVDPRLSALRVASLRASLGSCGIEVTIQMPVVINQPEMVEIGDRASINAFVHIWGAGGVRIGQRTMVASHTAISSITHDYDSDEMYRTVVTRPITIGNDVWIGTHAVILPGIQIGDGAVIGASCVVTRDVPPRAIVMGVPGTIRGYRPLPVEGQVS